MRNEEEVKVERIVVEGGLQRDGGEEEMVEKERVVVD